MRRTQQRRPRRRTDGGGADRQAAMSGGGGGRGGVGSRYFSSASSDGGLGGAGTNPPSSPPERARSRLRRPLPPTKREKLARPPPASSARRLELADAADPAFLVTAAKSAGSVAAARARGYGRALDGLVRDVNPELRNAASDSIQSAREYFAMLFDPTHELARRKNKGPNMDGRWWAVNLSLCLVPSALLVLVCEFHREEMAEFYDEMEKRDRERVLGGFGPEAGELVDEMESRGEMDSRGMNLMRGMKETESKSWGGEGGGGWGEMVSGGVRGVAGYLLGNGGGDGVVVREDEEEEPQSASEDRRVGTAMVPAHPDNRASSSHDAASAAAPAAPAVEASAAAFSVEGAPPLPPSPASSEAMRSFLRRIEALESELSESRDRDLKRRRVLEHRVRYELQRADQTGIRNRVDDRLIDKWKEDEEGMEGKTTGGEGDGTATRLARAGLETMSRNALDRWGFMADGGREMARTAWGAVLGDKGRDGEEGTTAAVAVAVGDEGNDEEDGCADGAGPVMTLSAIAERAAGEGAVDGSRDDSTAGVMTVDMAVTVADTTRASSGAATDGSTQQEEEEDSLSGKTPPPNGGVRSRWLQGKWWRRRGRGEEKEPSAPLDHDDEEGDAVSGKEELEGDGH